MGEPYDEDESNEYRLLPCEKCTELFPAIMLNEHQELCERFMELLSFDENVDFEAVAAAANVGDSRHVPPNDDASSDEAFCGICQRYFPNSTIDNHQVLCRVLLEQYTEFEAIKRLNTPPSDNKVRSELAHSVVSVPRKLETCEFCEVEISVNELEEHKYFCGSRTERCVYCNSNYEIRYRKNHIMCKNNCKNVPQSTPEKQKASLRNEKPKLKTYEPEILQNSPKAKETREVKAKIQHHRMPDSVLESEDQKGDENLNSEYSNHHKQKEQGQNLSFVKDEAEDSLNKEWSFKMLNNPLLKCIDQTETEDMCYLSDDDCDESLEEFWIRARKFLKRQSMLNV